MTRKLAEDRDQRRLEQKEMKQRLEAAETSGKTDFQVERERELKI